MYPGDLVMATRGALLTSRIEVNDRGQFVRWLPGALSDEPSVDDPGVIIAVAPPGPHRTLVETAIFVLTTRSLGWDLRESWEKR